jgi:hypothetical protein
MPYERAIKRLVAASAATLALAAATASAADLRPALRVVDRQPLVVRGVHFRPHERVRLTGAAIRPASVTTTAAGSFVVRLTQTSDDRCSGVMLLVAVGAAGDRAVLKLPQPECPPA